MYNSDIVHREEGKTFDNAKLIKCVGALIETNQQISCVYADNDTPFDGVGPIYHYLKGDEIRPTGDFNKINSFFKGTYVEEVIEDVRKYARDKYNVGLGRVRFLKLQPKTCYSWHRDPDEFRFHIPLITNPKCFFIAEKDRDDGIMPQVDSMPDVGQLYWFRSRGWHTAINAHLDLIRIHFVLDTQI